MEKGRLLSLDVFRGATIAGMILVNNGGDEPVVLLAPAARRLERVDADRPGLPVLPVHRRRRDGVLAPRAGRARGVAHGAAEARALARSRHLRARDVPQRIPQPLRALLLARLRRAAADRRLLRDHGDPGAVDGATGPDRRRRGLRIGLLAADAVRPRAGIRRADRRHPAPRSGPQPGGLAGSQAADGASLRGHARSRGSPEHDPGDRHQPAGASGRRLAALGAEPAGSRRWAWPCRG